MDREERASGIEGRSGGELGRLLGMLGLARRAGRLAVGTRAVRNALEEGSAEAVIVARDAGENALGRLSGPIDRSRVPVVRIAAAAEMGEALGRKRVVAAALTDRGLAAEFLSGGRSGASPFLAGRGGAAPGALGGEQEGGVPPEGSGGRSPGTE